MKNLIVLIWFLLLPILLLAQVNSNHVYVNGYYRSNGTYVKGYYRTAPNSTNRDNFSTKGNVNPYTGKPGWITPDNNTYNYTYSNTYSKPSYNSSNSYNSHYSSNPTYNSTSSSNYSYKTEWKANSTGYNFYFKGHNVSTTHEWRGNDLVVYYDNYAYLLEDYKLKKDGKIRLARNIPTWKYDGKGYYFYVDGKSVANETEHLKFGNDLLVKYKENVYLLPNFFNETNSNLKTAIELPKWKSTGNSYYFYINDNNVSDKTRNEWFNENLIVYYGNNGYILLDYKNQKDGKLKVALPIPTWSSNGNSYCFYLYGESIANKTTYKWNGNDLIVTYQGKDYILPNCKNLKDGKVRFALDGN